MSVVRFRIENRSAEPLTVRIEPWADEHLLAPGQAGTITRSGGDDRQPSFSVEDGILAVWEEGSGVLEFETEERSA